MRVWHPWILIRFAAVIAVGSYLIFDGTMYNKTRFPAKFSSCEGVKCRARHKWIQGRYYVRSGRHKHKTVPWNNSIKIEGVEGAHSARLSVTGAEWCPSLHHPSHNNTHIHTCIHTLSDPNTKNIVVDWIIHLIIEHCLLDPIRITCTIRRRDWTFHLSSARISVQSRVQHLLIR